MNRPERLTQSLTNNIASKTSRKLKPTVGKKLKRWKKAIAAATAPAAAPEAT